MADYAWVITTDHLNDDTDSESNAVGITGPRNASQSLLARLERGEGHTFNLWDDDENLYYTGRLITDGDMADEQHCFAPLDDFGAGWAGCVAVTWPGHPEWDCG